MKKKMFTLTSSLRNVNSNQNRDCFLTIKLERISFFKLVHIAGKRVMQGHFHVLPPGPGTSRPHGAHSLNT